MKYIIPILIVIAMLVSCAPMTGSITTETHPESKIVYMLDACGLDPESTGRTIADIVVTEIQIGKFSKAEVTTFIKKRIGAIEDGVTYYRFVNELEKYGKVLLAKKTDSVVSNVALVGYMMVKRKLNLNLMRVNMNLINQDKDITLRLLRFVLSEVEKYA